MVKKFLISCLFLIFIFTTITVSYGKSITITEEKLQTAIEKIIASVTNEKNYTVTVKNNVISVTYKGEQYQLKYDLTGNPTFTLTVPIKKGMTYEEYAEKEDILYLPLGGYAAIADILGVNFKDVASHFALSYFGGMINGSVNSSQYKIVDDIKVKVEKVDDSKIIYKSEFGEKIMQYVNDLYKTKQTVTDSSDLNSYVWTVERKDVTTDSCNLISTVSVNPEANFTSIIGSASESEGSGESGNPSTTSGDTKTDSNPAGDTSKQSSSGTSSPAKTPTSATASQNSQDSTVTNASRLPKAGLNAVIAVAISIFAILSIIYVIKLKQYKDIN